MKPSIVVTALLTFALALACGGQAPKPPPPPPPIIPASTEAATDDANAKCCCTYMQDETEFALEHTKADCDVQNGTCQSDAKACDDFAKQACCCLTEKQVEGETEQVETPSTWGACPETCIAGECATASADTDADKPATEATKSSTTSRSNRDPKYGNQPNRPTSGRGGLRASPDGGGSSSPSRPR